MSKMIIEEFKIEKQTKWKTINLTALEDPKLSPIAKFIHTYLVSRPPDWEIRIKDIINKSTAGRDAVYKGIKELIDRRYVSREQHRGERGRMTNIIYNVSLEPPLPEKPDTVTPDTVNPHTYYNNTANSQHNKTLSNERVIPEATSGFNGTPLLLRIKPRKKKNNGSFFNSNKPRRYKTISLNSWNQHPLNKKSKYDPPVIALQNKITRIKQPSRETKEVIDYWNKTASQLSNNGHKLPTHRLDLDTKTSYMCKLIVTGILHTSNLTVDDIKKAIDNYTKVLENSHYYTHLYSFPQFYGKEIFSDCVEGNLSKYINQPKKKLTKEGLLEAAIREHKLVHKNRPTYDDEDYYKQKIQSGAIETEDDARRAAR